MLEPVVDSLGEFFDFFSFFEGGQRQDVAVVLFELELQVVGELGQLAGVVERLLVIGLEHFIALELSIGQPSLVRR